MSAALNSDAAKAASNNPRVLSASLLLLLLLEHAIESLIRRIAARLRRLRRLERLIRGALSAGSRLLRLGSRALRSIRCVLRSFRCGANLVEILGLHGRTAGHGQDRKAADERRCPQSSLDFSGHLHIPLASDDKPASLFPKAASTAISTDATLSVHK